MIWYLCKETFACHFAYDALHKWQVVVMDNSQSVLLPLTNQN